MPTVKIYTQNENGSISVNKKNESLKKIKARFKRYANVYRCSYGKFPEGESLKTEIGQYTGIEIDVLVSWLNEVKEEWRLIKERSQDWVNRPTSYLNDVTSS